MGATRKRPRRWTAVLLCGLMLGLYGSGVAWFVGSDDSLLIGTHTVPEPARGLAVVTHPAITAFTDVDVLVEASAPGGVFLATSHRVDTDSLLARTERYEISRMKLGTVGGRMQDDGRKATFDRLRPDRIVGWGSVAAGPDAAPDRPADAELPESASLVATLDGTPLDVVIVPRAKDAAVTLSLSAHVPHLFSLHVGVALLGALLVLLWWALQVRRRRWDRRAAAAAAAPSDSSSPAAEDADEAAAEPAPVHVAAADLTPPAPPAASRTAALPRHPDHTGSGAVSGEVPPVGSVVEALYGSAASRPDVSSTAASGTASDDGASGQSTTPIPIPIPVQVDDAASPLKAPSDATSTDSDEEPPAPPVAEADSPLAPRSPASVPVSAPAAAPDDAAPAPRPGPFRRLRKARPQPQDEPAPDSAAQAPPAQATEVAPSPSPTGQGGRLPHAITVPILLVLLLSMALSGCTLPSAAPKTGYVPERVALSDAEASQVMGSEPVEVYAPAFTAYPMWAVVAQQRDDGAGHRLVLLERRSFASRWQRTGALRTADELPVPGNAFGYVSKLVRSDATAAGQLAARWWMNGERGSVAVPRPVRVERKRFLTSARQAAGVWVYGGEAEGDVHVVPVEGGHLALVTHRLVSDDSYALTSALLLRKGQPARLIGSTPRPASS